MKLGLYVSLLWAFTLVSHANIGDYNSAENKQWWNGEHHYKLRLHNEPLSLQQLLDAGIRPRHRAGLGEDTLHFKAKVFELVLSNGKSIIGENGYGEIRVTKYYQVTSVSFYEEINVNFERCRERLVASNQACEEPNTEDEIYAFLSAAKAAERHRTDETFFIAIPTKKQQKGYWYSYVESLNRGTKEHPFRFVMRTEIRDKANKRSQDDFHPLGVLLEPPKGYEHISFTYISPPAESNGPLILTPEEQAKLLADQLKKNHKENQDLSGESQTDSKYEPKLKTSEAKKNFALPWIISGLLLLVSLALLLKNKLAK